MTTTLTQRYIAATTSSLPADLQSDVRDELTGSISDAVEARIEQGEDPEVAERAVLTDLGDPAALAAGYADRPLHLIGPRYYLAWWRLLKLLLWIVPACVVGGVALGQLISEAPIGTVIGQSIVAGLGATVHLIFWTTLVFAILERSGADAGESWTLDQLPEPQAEGTGRADLIATLVFSALFIVAILWDQLRGFVRVDGEGVSLLHPDLWPWMILALCALIVLEVGLAVLASVRGRWTVGLAVTNTVLSVVFLVGSLLLLRSGLLINPEFVDLAFRDNGVDAETIRILGVLLGVGMVGISGWDVVDGWLKARRDARR